MGLPLMAILGGGGLLGLGKGSSSTPPPPPPGPVSTGGTAPNAATLAAASAAADHAMGAGDLAGKTQAATAAQSSSYRDTGTEMGLGG